MNVQIQDKVSKMSGAKVIFAEIHQDGYKLPEGKQLRGHFIDRCVQELGLKEKAAGTYYVNLRNLARGKSLYYKAKKAETVAVDLGNVAVDQPQGDVQEPEVQEPVQEQAPKRQRKAA